MKPVIIESGDRKKRMINSATQIIYQAAQKEIESYKQHPRVRYRNEVRYRKREGLFLIQKPSVRRINVSETEKFSAGIGGQIERNDGGVVKAFIFANIDGFNKLIDSLLLYPNGEILLAVRDDAIQEDIVQTDGNIKFIAPEGKVSYSLSIKTVYEDERRNRIYAVDLKDPDDVKQIEQLITKILELEDWPEIERQAIEQFAKNFFLLPRQNVPELDTVGKTVILFLKEGR